MPKSHNLIETSIGSFVASSSEGKSIDVNKTVIKGTGLPRKAVIETDFSGQQYVKKRIQEITTSMKTRKDFTNTILKTELNIKQNHHLEAVKMNEDPLIVTLNGLLDLEKVDLDQIIFEKNAFKIKTSVSAILQLFDSKIQEKNLELITEYDNQIPDFIIGDQVCLHQIVLKLFNNAIKFTIKGKITLRINLLYEDPDHVIIEFVFTDTGSGIPEHKIGKIFEKFLQASNQTSIVYVGTALGLATVKQLIESQGGTIRVKSAVDVGSTFSFTLPFQKINAEADLQNELVKLNTEIKNRKILLVEAILINQLVVKTLVDDFGLELDIAENGKIAIEKLKENQYDIVLIDLQMAEISGFETMAYIQNTLNLKIPVIALTADVTTIDLIKYQAVGINGYLAKPVDEILLYSTIIGILKNPIFSPKINKSLEEKKTIKKETCINLAYLKQITKSNPALMMEMITIYLTQTPVLIKTIKQSLSNQNWFLLSAATHKIVPSFAIVGISSEYEKIAKEIQELASDPEGTKGIKHLVLQIEEVCAQACIELQDELNKIKNTI